METRPEELSPLDVIALEALLDGYCPCLDGSVYDREVCRLKRCTVCEDLLIHKEPSP